MDPAGLKELAEKFESAMAAFVDGHGDPVYRFPNLAAEFLEGADHDQKLAWALLNLKGPVNDWMREYWNRQDLAKDRTAVLREKAEERRNKRLDGKAQREVQRLSRGWFVPSRKGHLNLAEMTKEEVLEVAGLEEATGHSYLATAQFLKSIAKTLGAGQLVSDRYTAEQLDAKLRNYEAILAA